VSRTDDFDEGWAVVRVDLFRARANPDDLNDCVQVKEIWWTSEEAAAEVDRLNALREKDGVGSRYFAQYVRVRRRS
jgi:hypothetical protein